MPQKTMVPGVSIFVFKNLSEKKEKKEIADKKLKEDEKSFLPPSPNLTQEQRYKIREYCGR